jgi:hypothetical protein
VVLSRTLCVLLAVAGCNQSLFDAFGDRPDGGGGGGDGGGDGPDVPTSCPDTCVADAAKNFAEPGPFWRYAEEGPAYFWPDMSFDGQGWLGTESENRFKLCRDNASAPACESMRDALLVSSAGNSSMFIPALEFKAGGTRVLHLIVRAYVPGDSAEHKIRLYRNSREDVLFTQLAMPGGAIIERDIIVDALPDDRFVVAIEPTGPLGGTAALDFFVSDQGDPSACQLAAAFPIAAGTVIDDLCGDRDLTSRTGTGGAETPPTIDSSGGPYALQGSFVRIAPGDYLEAPEPRKLVRSGGPLTVQFWVKLTATGGFVFSDFDPETGGGGSSLEFVGFPAMPRLQVTAAKTVSPTITLIINDVLFPLDQWRFVRMVDTPGTITVCIDGVRAMFLSVAPDRPEANQTLHLGKNAMFQTTATFDGEVDDVRVIARELPCEQTN